MAERSRPWSRNSVASQEDRFSIQIDHSRGQRAASCENHANRLVCRRHPEGGPCREEDLRWSRLSGSGGENGDLFPLREMQEGRVSFERVSGKGVEIGA